MSHRTVIVVGAGPKGIAIGAKARALSAIGYSAPEVVLVDEHGVAAHWSGAAGFTDGRQPLGTPPEKDVGFPYKYTLWGKADPALRRQMQAYSWQSYRIAKSSFSEWIDRGRPAPSHAEFGRYLEWVAAEASLDVRLGAVESIDNEAECWRVFYRQGYGDHTEIVGDALVITGPGDPLRIAAQPAEHPRVFDGRSFWRRQSRWRPNSSVAVIGSGETAASIALALLDELHQKATIAIITPPGILYSRGESFTENRPFSDPSNWDDREERDKRELIERAGRGVFSVRAQSVLNAAEGRVSPRPGRVTEMECSDNWVELRIRDRRREYSERFDYAIIATGFFPLSFSKFAVKRFASQLFPLLSVSDWAELARDRLRQKEAQRKIETQIGEELALRGFVPPLHLPMLAGAAQGPGFPNLSCLGLLSDRILWKYAVLGPKVLGSGVVGQPQGPSEVTAEREEVHSPKNQSYRLEEEQSGVYNSCLFWSRTHGLGRASVCL